MARIDQQFQLVGDKALIKKLQYLSDKAAKKVMLPAIRKGLKPIKAEAKKRVPVKSGLLKKAISASARSTRDGDKVTGKVYVNPKVQGVDAKGKKHKPYKIAHIIEFGSVKTPAIPFLRPALDDKSDEAKQIITKEAKINLDKVVSTMDKIFYYDV